MSMSDDEDFSERMRCASRRVSASCSPSQPRGRVDPSRGGHRSRGNIPLRPPLLVHALVAPTLPHYDLRVPRKVGGRRDREEGRMHMSHAPPSFLVLESTSW